MSANRIVLKGKRAAPLRLLEDAPHDQAFDKDEKLSDHLALACDFLLRGRTDTFGFASNAGVASRANTSSKLEAGADCSLRLAGSLPTTTDRPSAVSALSTVPISAPSLPASNRITH